MPAEAPGQLQIEPFPPPFLAQLAGPDELLVSSRDPAGRGTVRMWFAVVPPGYVFLLTQPYSRKVERWRQDPWVRLQIPGSRTVQEGIVVEVGWEEASLHSQLLTTRFDMAGAATPEALRWMLQDGSRLLFKAGLKPGASSDALGAIRHLDRR